MGQRFLLAFLVAVIASWASAAGACIQDQASPVPAPISVCAAYAERMSLGGQTIAVQGIYGSDQLHSSFASNDCPEIGFGVRMGAISLERRQALDRHLFTVRNGGWLDVPVTFVGDLRPAGEFGGWELWVTDFSSP